MLTIPFSDKYTRTTNAEIGKIVISDDAFAVGEVIEALITKLEQVRLTWL